VRQATFTGINILRETLIDVTRLAIECKLMRSSHTDASIRTSATWPRSLPIAF